MIARYCILARPFLKKHSEIQTEQMEHTMMPLALGEQVGRRDWESRLSEQVRRSGLTSRLGEEVARRRSKNLAFKGPKWLPKSPSYFHRQKMAGLQKCTKALLLGKVTKSLAFGQSLKKDLKDPNKLRSPKPASKRFRRHKKTKLFPQGQTSLQEAKVASKGQNCLQG